MHIPHFGYPFICWYLGCFHLLATVTNATRNMCVHKPVQVSVFSSFGCTPMSRIAGSYGHSTIWNDLEKDGSFEKLPNRFHSRCTTVQSHQRCTRGSISLQPHQYLLSSTLLIIAILVGVKWYLHCSNLLSFDQEAQAARWRKDSISYKQCCNKWTSNHTKNKPWSKLHTLHKHWLMTDHRLKCKM